MNFSKRFQEIAKSELREDSSRKLQSMNQFREWLFKHPHIEKCRIDDTFLLSFLRAKKFSVSRAMETLENYLITIKVHRNWFGNLNLQEKRINDLFESGFAFPLKERDKHGRRVIFNCPHNFDLNRFDATDSIRLLALIVAGILEEEETQIAGVSFIVDGSQVSMSYVAKFSLTDMRAIAKLVQDTLPIRVKEYHYISLPIFATTFVELALSVLNKKMSKRVIFSKSIDELKNKIDIEILPREYGGRIPIRHMLDDFREKLQRNQEKILDIDSSIVNTTKHKKWIDNSYDLGIGGSFRKLEID